MAFVRHFVEICPALSGTCLCHVSTLLMIYSDLTIKSRVSFAFLCVDVKGTCSVLTHLQNNVGGVVLKSKELTVHVT